MVSKMTDVVIPYIKEWQNRPLNKVYPFVFMDAIHYKVREDGKIKNKAVYVVLGVDLEGFKDCMFSTFLFIMYFKRLKECYTSHA